jgi:iron complex transport system substrate-binding protein
MRLLRTSFVILSIVWSASALAEAAPRRVLSFNLCADQLALALADRDQIAGLSIYAADPQESVIATQARGIPQVQSRAEATVALAPDLVLIGPIYRPAMQRILAEQGIRLLTVDLVGSIDAAKAQIREVAAALGHPPRGEALVAEVEAARGRLASVRRTDGATALVLERGGYVAGAESLTAALLAEAGLRPPAGAPAGYGLPTTLERLITLKPDYIVLDNPAIEAEDQGAMFLAHPALKALYPSERRIALPHRFTFCGGPALVAALDYLTGVMQRMPPIRR